MINTPVKSMAVSTLIVAIIFQMFPMRMTAQHIGVGKSVVYNHIIYTGQVIDSETGEPLPSAQINSIFKRNDSTLVKMYVADREGKFKFTAPRTYNSRMEVVYLGYKLFEQPLPQDKQNEIYLGKLRIEPDTLKIDEVVIMARMSLYKMEGDTTLIFPAAIKQMQGDALIDLLRRHPLFKVDDTGNVWMNGKLIERVNVNGKLIFGESVSTTINTLDSKDVSLLKVYDEVDEKDEIISGTKNARKRSVMGVITISDFDTSTTANIAVEGGIDRVESVDRDQELRYYADGRIGRFNENLRMQIGGLIDNRPFKVMAGESTSTPGNSYQRLAGANAKYENSTSDMLKLFSVEYKYDNIFSKNVNYSQQIYLPSQYFNSQSSSSNSSSVNNQNTHRVNICYGNTVIRKYGIDSHYIFSFDNNSPQSLLINNIITDGVPTSYNHRSSVSNGNGYHHEIKLDAMKSLGESGGGIVLRVKGRISKSNDMQIRRDTTNSLGIANKDILKIFSNKPRYELHASLQYTHISKIGLFRNTMEVQYNKERSYAIAINDFTSKVDTTLSGDVYSNSLELRNTISYHKQINKMFELTVKAVFSVIKSDYDEMFPESESIDKWYYSLMPDLAILYRKPTSKGDINSSLTFRGYQSVMPLIYLSGRLNDTNPLYLSVGNPNLRPKSTYQITFNVSIPYGIAFNISNAWIHKEQTNYYRYFTSNTILPEYNDYEALAGSTLRTMINGSNYHDFSFMANYSKRIPLFMLSAGLKYTFRNPEIGGNNEIFRTHNHGVDLGLSLKSNFSSDVRVDINNRTSYQWYNNGNDYINKTFRNQLMTTLRWDISERATFRSVYLYEHCNIPTFSITSNNHILNASIGYRIFKKRNGTISFNAYDILNRASKINVNVTDLYVQSALNQISSSYFTLSFNYRFSNQK